MPPRDTVAVITGSSRGFGLAVARSLARAGARVVLSSRSGSDARAAAASLGGEALGLACDVRERRDVGALLDAAVARFGKVDLWINNAGKGAPYGRTGEVPEAAFLETTETLIHGAYFGTMAALAHMRPRGGGQIVNVVGRGEKGPVPMQTAYASAKAWLRNFTLALDREYRSDGMQILAFQPGLMDTDMVRRPETLPEYAGQMRVLGTVLRLWGVDPAVSAARLIAALDARKHGYASAHGALWLLLGPLRILAGRRPRVPVEARVVG